jgi:hypothetical protein
VEWSGVMLLRVGFQRTARGRASKTRRVGAVLVLLICLSREGVGGM